MNNTTQRNIHYWASRPDRNNIEYFWAKLKVGELRQGWGYHESQNLDLIRDAQESGGSKWWAQLSDDAQAAYRNYPFNPRWDDAMRKGDLVLVPNVPQWGHFSVVRLLDDEYHYDIDPLHGDYGHWRRVELLTPQDGINWLAEGVSADIRATVRARSRIWRINHLGEQLEALIDQARKNPKSYAEGISVAVRYEKLMLPLAQSARLAARKHALEDLARTLDGKFHAAELEGAVQQTLRLLYPEGSVEQHGGIAEARHGTDLLLRLPNPLDRAKRQIAIAIQVKAHEGETHEGASQLELAAKFWRHPENSTDLRLIALALVTSAEKISDESRAHLDRIENSTGLTVHVITRQWLIELFAEAALRHPMDFIQYCTDDQRPGLHQDETA